MTSIDKISFFCLLSGENPELAFYELESISAVFNNSLKVKCESDPRIVSITFEGNLNEVNSLELIRKIISRSTLVHWCCQTFYYKETRNFTSKDLNRVKSEFKEIFLARINETSSFRINTKRIGSSLAIFADTNEIQDLNQFFGSVIQQKYPLKPVNLKQPEEVFNVVVSPNGLWFGTHRHFTSKSRQKTNCKRKTLFSPKFDESYTTKNIN